MTRQESKNWFISRPKEKNGVRKGAWRYERDSKGDIESIQRLEEETIFNKKSKRYEKKVYSYEQGK